MSNESNNQINKNDNIDVFPVQQAVSQQPTLGAFGIKPPTAPSFGMGLPQTQTQTQNQSTGGFSFGGFQPPQAPQAMPAPAPSQQAPRSMCGGIGGLGGPFVPFGTNNNNDKKKQIDALYNELGKIRAEIEKLHKSTDVIYEILRNI